MNEYMKNKFKISGLILILLAYGFTASKAQTNITLKECLEYSLKNNINVKISNYDQEISEKRVKEMEGFYLPSVNLTASIDNNLIITTQLLPAEMLGGAPGTFIPVRFGTPYNVAAGLSLTQRVYDAATIYDIKLSKINNELSKEIVQKTNESVVYGISFVYYGSMIIQIQKEMLKTKLASTEELLKSAELQFKNGVIKQIDVDKIRVTYNTTQSQLRQAELNYTQTINSLKFNMGMPLDSKVVLYDSIVERNIKNPINIENTNYQIANTIDYKMKENNFNYMEMSKKKSLAAFQPFISVYGNFRVSAMRKAFNFLSAGEDWYPSSGIGIQLSLPIYMGNQRNNRVDQAQINIEKAKATLLNTEESIKVDISNFEMKFKNAYDNIQNEKENMDLAEGIYKNVKLQYQQGASSSIELIQAESSYTLAQNTYLNKLFDLFIARIDLEKAQGNLVNFINNLK